ncbi:MAG: DNA-processing protein DprA, partial [Candidatus Latescibacteria bacterium]|nr:DNA-processing protein DprA [Candidatus Latescibacterota bacterium]
MRYVYDQEWGVRMSEGGQDVEKIRGAIAALRNAGYDPRKFDRATARALNEYDRQCLDKDMAFILGRGIDVLTEGDERFPGAFTRSLGKGCPRMLFCTGNLSLLNRPAILVCGSRDATRKGLDFAYRCGRLIAEEGFTVVSGYARGVDLAAHQGALEGGGDTVAL